MKILIITPSLNIHGGIRVLVEWANHLSRRGHSVTLQVEAGQMRADWIAIDPAVSVRPGPNWTPAGFDVAVAGTPNIACRLDPVQTTAKKFFLLQMAEELFAPGNQQYVATCLQSYRVKMPIIGISKWVEEHVRTAGRGGGLMHYIGNGVSEDFRPGEKDDALTVLVEGWECYNPAKDVSAFGPKAAAHLKKKYGARIIAFSQLPLKTAPSVPDEYYRGPSGSLLVSLYQRPTLMLKATRFDARSCAPVEAMSCGTVTARAIERGDDDLTDGVNCLKSGYDLDRLIANAEALIEDDALRAKLTRNGLRYRKKYLSWNYWMGRVEQIIEQTEAPVPVAEVQSRRRTL